MTTCAVVGNVPRLTEAVEGAQGDDEAIVLGGRLGPGAADVTAVLCDEEVRWLHVKQLAGESHPVVAVLPALELAAYQRALALGAAVVHCEAPAPVLLEVLRGAMRAEVLIPMEVARFLATGVRARVYVAPREREVLGLMASGHTMTSVAARLHYSERTIRRWVQGLHLRFGSSTRAELLTATEPYL